MKGIDTNILIRYLVADDEEQATRAANFIERECSRDDPGYLNRIVMCELVWVLRRLYGYRREQISDTIKALLSAAELRVEDQDSAWNAVRDDDAGTCDFADSYLARTNRKAGCVTTVTFDSKAARLSDYEPI